jgi:hypothetical protein
VCPNYRVVDSWPCPGGIAQEKTAIEHMKKHRSCCTWAGGETFTVHNRPAFLAELRQFFGMEPTAAQPSEQYTLWQLLGETLGFLTGQPQWVFVWAVLIVLNLLSMTNSNRIVVFWVLALFPVFAWLCRRIRDNQNLRD